VKVVGGIGWWWFWSLWTAALYRRFAEVPKAAIKRRTPKQVNKPIVCAFQDEDNEQMRNPLQVGIIGLGSRWRRRYRRALQTLGKSFEVRAVCDQVRERADREARRLGCAATAGPTALLDRHDVDALLLLDTQWYRLWPVEQAARAGKPVYCAASLEAEGARAEALVEQVRASGLPVQMEMAPQAAPAAKELRKLLETQLGPARVLVIDLLQTVKNLAGLPGTSRAASGLLGRHGIALVDWCAELMGDRPGSVLAGRGANESLVNLLFTFPGERVAQLTCRRAVFSTAGLSVEVIAERGTARMEYPRRLRWSTADGRHYHESPPGGSVEVLLLERFHRALTRNEPIRPGLEDAQRVLGWLRAAARSLAEGRRMALE